MSTSQVSNQCTVLKYHRYGPDGNTIVESFSIVVGRLPERRQQALYLCQTGAIIPIAYFLKDEYADIVARLFSQLLEHRGFIN